MWNVWIPVFGIAFIFVMTSLGAAVVFFFKGEISPKFNSAFLGFASGVMIAASVWSLLLPAIAQAEAYLGGFAFLPAAIGVLVGGAFLVLLDKLAPKRGRENELLLSPKEYITRQKAKRLFLAVTMHNIPEGLAVGFAFGAALVSGSAAALMTALGLAVGIGVQNFPEGAAISLPMKSVFKSNTKAFLWGAASGVAEPIFALLGFFLAANLQALQPWLLGFSAGAMLFVAAEDLIPDARMENSPHLGAWGVLFGFTLMMILDVALS
ncbi:MAG: ZIP family metal transporter [Clostridia bacterium]|nr:ZIP family metal transporter [Clostridia bacterium]